MARAARAIIIENGKMLVMQRNKFGSLYFTLVGGRVNDTENLEQALVREVKEETGFDVVAGRLVYVQMHAAPYNEQYIYLCELAQHNEAAVQATSEEGIMNQYDMNTHQPQWVSLSAFAHLPFRTPDLHEAIIHALKKGFPKEPVKL